MTDPAIAGAIAGATAIAKVFVINLLLSADNVLLIALAVRHLPAGQARDATLIGTVGAITLRVLVAWPVVWLLGLPWLRLAAAALLLFIALRLSIDQDEAEALETPGHAGPASGWRLPWQGADQPVTRAVGSILAADAVMSLDNVVALGAVSNGDLLLLGFGLALCIPMLIYGSAIIRGLLRGHGRLVLLAGMFLGWVAGGIAVSDPAAQPWIDSQAPALAFSVPLGCALFVLWEARILCPPRSPLARPPALPGATP